MTISVKTLEKVKWRFVQKLSFRLRRKGGLSIGVDLGSHLTKFVVLQRKGQQYLLVDWGVEPVSQSLDSEAFDTPIPCGQRLAQWSKKVKRPLRLGVSVSGPRVMVKMLQLPSMSEKDIREHFRWELDRYISREMGEVLWDFHVSATVPVDSSKQTQVLLVVAQKEWIESIMSDFKECKIDFVDVDALALTNLATISSGVEESQLLAHVGPSGILLVVMNKGEMEWSREVPFAVEWYGDLIDQIRFAQNSSTGENQMAISAKILWEPFLEEVSGQVQAVIREWSSIEPSQPLAGVILSGGYTIVDGMAMMLSRKLGMPVKSVDPFTMIEIPPAFSQDPTFVTAAPLLGVAVGVALRGSVSV